MPAVPFTSIPGNEVSGEGPSPQSTGCNVKAMAGKSSLALVLCVSLALCLLPQSRSFAQSDAEDFPPTDEAAEQPELFQFRKSVVAAIEAGDKSRFFSFLDPEVEHRVQDSAFGQYAREGIWDEREEIVSILKLGGKFVRVGLFVAPYTAAAGFGRPPEEQWKHVVVTGVDVPVYERPDGRSAVLARLTHVVVRLFDDVAPLQEKYSVDLQTEGREWEVTQLSGGITGFVRKETVMYPERPLIQFEKKNGKWVITIVDVFRL